MNYPIWDVAFGAGLLMAVVAILHVFVSHFAVGGGLFLVLTERKALRCNDVELLGWLKSHTQFFVLVTVVFGAISGVGIWFTIGLISPTATSNLIHAYVWGWAIEWIFFFVEITAALLYLHGWEKLDARLHQWYGWIYFLAAFASMVVINGIITFMLTPGRWIENHQFWSGFFNPTNFPSLLLRFAISLALAGVYALITASVQRDGPLKARIVRWSALWIVPSLAVVPAFGWWYMRKVPPELWASARGPMPTATHFAVLVGILFPVTLVLALIALFRPGRLHLAFSLLVAMAALGAMGSFEFVREAIRKPYVIGNYLYGNSLYTTSIPGDGGFTPEKIDRAGVLNTAKWLEVRELNSENQVTVGREIFRVECASCHTTDSYRGVRKFLAARQWDRNKTEAILGSLDRLHNGVMPPFAGTNAERDALAAFLNSLAPQPAGANVAVNGETVFEKNCAACHQVRPDDPLFRGLPKDPLVAASALKNLPALFSGMPNIKLSEPERAALVEWVGTQRGTGGSTPRAGGN
jgi:mono/diheme cytochrome c family protein